MHLKSILTGCIFFTISPCLQIFAETSSLKQEALAAHNILRAAYHAPPLSWDNKLARYAASYASHCQFHHSGSPYGENLSKGYPTVTDAIYGWYSENRLYSYRHPGFSLQTGHFTQLVWRSTNKLGCGYAECHDSRGRPWGYLVCEYYPHGNVLSTAYFQANVAKRG